MGRGVAFGLLFAALLAGAVFFVLRGGSGGGTVSPTGPGKTIRSASELKPDALYSDKAELILSDLTLPVDMARRVEGENVLFEFSTGAVIVDTEVYQSTTKVFGLMKMNMESYDPAIVLLKFPMNVGDSWEWKGVQESGGRHHKSWDETSSFASQTDAASRSEPTAIRSPVSRSILKRLIAGSRDGRPLASSTSIAAPQLPPDHRRI
jgi:hypothetical protein